MIGTLCLTGCFIFAPVPANLPDLWTVVICGYCCSHFILFSFLFHLIQFTLPDTDNQAIEFSSACCHLKSDEKKKN